MKRRRSLTILAVASVFFFALLTVWRTAGSDHDAPAEERIRLTHAVDHADDYVDASKEEAKEFVRPSGIDAIGDRRVHFSEQHVALERAWHNAVRTPKPAHDQALTPDRVALTEESRQTLNKGVSMWQRTTGEQRTANTRQPTPTSRSVTTMGSQTNETIGKYLLCELKYGPNNQYHCFVECVKLAIVLNRTVALLPFRLHYLDRRRLGLSTEGAGLNNTELVRRRIASARSFHSTFDIDALASVIPRSHIISAADFARVLEQRAHVVDCLWNLDVPEPSRWEFAGDFVGNITPARRVRARPSNLTTEGIIDALGIAHTSYHTIAVDNLFLRNSVYRVDRRSLVHGGLWERDRYLATLRGVVHAPHIVAQASIFVASYIRKAVPLQDEYIAIHWRRADFAHVSKENCKSVGADCQDTTGIAELLDVLDSAFLSLRSASWVAKEYGRPSRRSSNATFEGMEHTRPIVYVSATRLLSDEIAALEQRGYRDIIRYEPPPGQDAYYTSLIEQEICLRATSFVASPLSTWSDRILVTRIALGSTHTWSASQLVVSESNYTHSALVPPQLSRLIASNTICGYVYMGVSREPPNIMSLRCPGGNSVIESVLFASFGAPSGICGTFAPDELCHSSESVERVTGLCVGRGHCDIPVTNNVAEGGFSIACSKPMGGHALAVLATCGIPKESQSATVDS